MYGLQCLLAILDVVTVYVQIVNFWQNIWHPRLVYCRIFDIRYWTIAECLTSKVSLLQNIWQQKLLYCRIFDIRGWSITECSNFLGMSRYSFCSSCSNFWAINQKKGACLLVKYQRRLTQMDPLFIVHSFFCEKTNKTSL